MSLTIVHVLACFCVNHHVSMSNMTIIMALTYLTRQCHLMSNMLINIPLTCLKCQKLCHLHVQHISIIMPLTCQSSCHKIVKHVNQHVTKLSNMSIIIPLTCYFVLHVNLYCNLGWIFYSFEHKKWRFSDFPSDIEIHVCSLHCFEIVTKLIFEAFRHVKDAEGLSLHNPPLNTKGCVAVAFCIHCRPMMFICSQINTEAHVWQKNVDCRLG